MYTLLLVFCRGKGRPRKRRNADGSPQCTNLTCVRRSDELRACIMNRSDHEEREATVAAGKQTIARMETQLAVHVRKRRQCSDELAQLQANHDILLHAGDPASLQVSLDQSNAVVQLQGLMAHESVLKHQTFKDDANAQLQY